ncbi:MAG: divalent-cation tolerance protein CutA [Candidatus Brocadiaceae bacterium]|jgi:periplasmic divalent cation tolerance protein
MADVVLVMVTCGSSGEAESLSRKLLDERLIACVNIAGRIRSLFRWEGAVARESESLLLMKTRRELLGKLCERIKELHSYEVPEVVAFPIVEGNPDYLNWVEESVAESD